MSPMPQYSDDDQTPASSPKIQKNGNSNTAKEHQNNCNDSIINVKIAEHTEKADCGNLTETNGTEVGLELTESKEDAKETISEKNGSLKRDISSDTVADAVQNNINYLAQLSIESCGFPLAIFTKGSLCLPYLSLPYLDLLTDVNVRSYVVGATNILFKQKRQLYDILVDIDSGRIECQDINLRKLLHLTTEDLRFADYIVKHVSEEKFDVFLDGVGWEGGDEWIRTQFRIYLLCLLRTSMLPGGLWWFLCCWCVYRECFIVDGSREIDLFNANYVSGWRETHNYKMWLSGINPGILDVHPGHPFAGQLSVADMKLRLAQ